jgi:hypothetical protein
MLGGVMYGSIGDVQQAMDEGMYNKRWTKAMYNSVMISHLLPKTRALARLYCWVTDCSVLLGRATYLG